MRSTKKIQSILISLCCLLAIYFYQHWSSNKQIPLASASWQKALEYAKLHLPKEGRLIMTRDGFGYLKVDDRYIHELFPLLEVQKKGFSKPPHFRAYNSPGAHISVFTNQHNHIAEVGEMFHFEPVKLAVVRTNKNTYIVLQVQSPELEALRKKYGLSPKLQNHDFHITIAQRRRL